MFLLDCVVDLTILNSILYLSCLFSNYPPFIEFFFFICFLQVLLTLHIDKSSIRFIHLLVGSFLNLWNRDAIIRVLGVASNVIFLVDQLGYLLSGKLKRNSYLLFVNYFKWMQLKVRQLEYAWLIYFFQLAHRGKEKIFELLI